MALTREYSPRSNPRIAPVSRCTCCVAALWLTAALTGCQEPGVALTARPAATTAASPSLRAAYIRARQEGAGARYAVTRQAGALVAHNRPHGFDARFDAAGVRLSGVAGWSAKLRLKRYGRQGASRQVTGRRPSARHNRVDREHRCANGASVSEWYLNGPLGLEQGFTLASSPPGKTDRIELELELTGDLHPRPGRDSRSAVLASRVGEAVLAYRDLFAHDVRGRRLDAGLGVSGRRITLWVDVRGATFPVTVDPLITTESKLPTPVVDDYANGDKFGAAVAVHKDTAVVGAQEDGDTVNKSGSAYVFVKQGSTWRVQAKLLASDGALYDMFGKAVAINGDTVVVGANEDDDKGGNSGSAYVFVRKGTGWSQQQKIVPADGAAWDLFGSSVAVSGDTLVVGAEKDDDKGLDSGSAYVYVRSGTSWSLQQKLVGASGKPDDGFGRAVAAAKDTVAVGTPRDNSKGGNAGAVYVYARSGTSWSQQQKLTASDATAGDALGWSVALEGDTLVVGAPWEETGVWESGSAYVFVRSGSTWTQQQKIKGTSLSVFDNFGYSVAISGERVAVGAHKDDVKVVDQGSTFVFTRSGTTWSQSGQVSASDGSPGDEFGHAVAITGTTVLVGSYVDDLKKKDEGSLYVYTLAGTAWQQQKALAQRPGGIAGDWLGYSVALAGDTAVVGNPRDDDKGKDSGSAHVFLRGKSGWTHQQMLLSSDGEAGDNFGHAVAVSGDTVAVGAPLDRSSSISPRFGAMYVFGRSGTAWSQRYKAVGATINDQLGFSVALHKDTLVAGAPYHDAKGADSGAAHVFTRSGTAWSQQTKLLASSGGAGDRFGHAVTVNGDTVVVGAPYDDDKGGDSGAAFVFARKGSSWSQQKLLLAADAAAADLFGTGVALEGNTAVVGAPADDDKGSGSGAAYVFARKGTAWSQQQKLVPVDLTAGAGFGTAEGAYQDTVVVGAPGLASGAGAAYVFLRSGTKWTMEKKITASDAAAGDKLGHAVALGGDTAVVGAYGNDDPYADMGAAYAYKVQRPNGVACLSGGQCNSGHCVEGVCCDKACGGALQSDCQACTVAKGASVDGTCGPVKAGQSCRAAAGDCDVAEACDGSNTACPADKLRAGSHVCRVAAGGCDVAENCTGLSKTCPADVLVAKDKTCRKSLSGCDPAEVCDGTTAKCPADKVEAKGTVCRASTAPCDAAETCDGTAAPCPADKLAIKGAVCRKAAAPCDAAETCDGVGKGCPADKIAVKGAVCRKAAGGCDVGETCDGATTACPADKLVQKGVVCRKGAGDCDVAEACTGSAAACPADAFKAKGTSCRKAAGDCDVAEACTGSAAACPADSLKAKGTACRKAAGDCDEAESCDGAKSACPADALKAKGAVCRKAAGECDLKETCGGSTVTCPADKYQPAGTKCLKGAGTCKAGKCEKVNDAGLDSTTLEAGADSTAGTEAGADSGADKGEVDKGGADKATAPDQGKDTDPEENGGCCDVGGSPGGSGWVLLLLGVLWLRRSRGGFYTKS